MNLGLFKRKEIWLPTWRGWLLILLISLGLGAGAVLATVPFLAPVEPLHKGILVVEGWLPDYALEEAKGRFENDRYRLIVVAGVPIEKGYHISREKNYAQLGASTLMSLGVKPDVIVAAPCRAVPRNRTYATAKRVRVWLDANAPGEPVDVFTLGVHGRRTWLLYEMALGQAYKVGIISGNDRRYTPHRWCMTSSGVRVVISEAIAYLYAKLLFFPGSAEALEAASEGASIRAPSQRGSEGAALWPRSRILRRSSGERGLAGCPCFSWVMCLLFKRSDRAGRRRPLRSSIPRRCASPAPRHRGLGAPANFPHCAPHPVQCQ